MHPFRGIHIFGEMYGLDPKLLCDVEFLKEVFCQAIKASGASLCGIQVQKFQPEGLTLLALLSESHASLHTYPEFESLFFDAFTCGDHCKPERIAEVLEKSLKPRSQTLRSLLRGWGFSSEREKLHIPGCSGAAFCTETTV